MSIESLYLNPVGRTLEQRVGCVGPYIGLLTAERFYLLRQVGVKGVILGNPIADSLEQSLAHFILEDSPRGKLAVKATRIIQTYYQGDLLEISSNYLSRHFPYFSDKLRCFQASAVGQVLLSERLRSCAVALAALAGVSFAPVFLLSKILKPDSEAENK